MENNIKNPIYFDNIDNTYRCSYCHKEFNLKSDAIIHTINERGKKYGHE